MSDISNAKSVSGSRNSEKWLWLVVLVLLLLVCCNAYMRVLNYQSVDRVVGTWTALAQDANDGILYRPLVGERGFGGTRYMPLYFLLHAAGIRLGLPPMTAGMLLSAVIQICLLVGVYFLLKQMGASRSLAGAGALLVTASGIFLQLLTTVRGDDLPLALGIWGLYLAMDRRSGRWSLIGASCLFALCFFSKFTAVAAPGAALLSIWFQGQKSRAAWLTGLSIAWSLAFLGILEVLSSGRFVEIMISCSAGGMNWYSILTAVSRLIKLLDIPGLLMFFLGLGAWLQYVRKYPVGMPSIYFVLTVIITIIIFASPGTSANHLLDMFVASIIITVGWIIKLDEKMIKKSGVVFLALIGLFGAGNYLELLGEQIVHPYDKRSALMSVVKQASTTEGTILTGNPTIPVLAGQIPYLSDPFMLVLLAHKHPELKQALSQQIREKKFASVVLWDLAGDPQGPCLTCLDVDFVEDIKQSYYFAKKAGSYQIFLPKP